MSSKKTRSKVRKCKGSARKQPIAKKKRNLIQKSELPSGFMYIRIQQRDKGQKYFLSARNLRFMANKNGEKHMADHDMVEQQLYILYCVRYLPSNLSVSGIKEAINSSITTIEDNLTKFVEEYNDKIKLFPDKFKYDNTPKYFTPNINGDEFEIEYNNLLNQFIQSHGPLVQTFKHPPGFNVQYDQNENENKSNTRDNSKEENDDGESPDVEDNDDEKQAEDDDNDVLDLTPFGDDAGSKQIIAGLQNNIQMLTKQMYQKDHRIRTLTKQLENETYLKAKAEKERGKYENEMRSMKRKMDNIKSTESGIFTMAKNTLNKDSASRLIIKLNKYFVGSSSGLLADKKHIIDKQNKKEIEKERRSYSFRIKMAINYYDGHFTQSQIRMVRNATNSEVVVHKRR